MCKQNNTIISTSIASTTIAGKHNPREDKDILKALHYIFWQE
jgi:hypothetical protein